MPIASQTPNKHTYTQYKKEYAVRLSGFPADALVTVQALRIDDINEEAEAVRLMATVTTDAEGRAAVR